MLVFVVLKNSSFNGVFHKHCNGHWTNPSGNGCDCRSNRLNTFIIHVAAELTVFVAVHTNVDYDCTFFNHIRSYKFCFAYSGNNDVCPLCNFLKVLCAAVTYCNSCILMKKKHCLGFTYNIASAYYNTFLAAYVDVCKVDKLHYTCRCAGKKIEVTNHNFAYVYGVERINILFGRDRKKHLFAINTLGERKLDKNAVNILAIVKSINELKKFFLGSFSR